MGNLPIMIVARNETIRRLRIKAGLTQFALAARCGCALNTVANAERWGAVSRKTAEAMAPVLRCRPEDLLAKSPGGRDE